ncbi:glycosyltransferase family 4 protein [Donghicola eburneus]|uniref:glycosyltransferase family 4 protein n=1 Tax=Donghicola eburneus TaxID=393278 RepID=UPI0008E01DF4|nr:MraY family glycosyltransferase [Donghicola eburneus]SFQ80781.1 UDP-N-acetylmuramyl pentapeptide phosphotransferase/UDP-N-acetylglucosamine-1-phosphate transferase [Donghicola eburneus]
MLYAIAFLLSAAICGAIVHLNNNSALRLTRDEDLGAIQASHSRPTPRLGGVGIVLALMVAILLSSGTIGTHYLVVLAAGGVLAVVSLLEDIGKPMSPRTRLIAAAISAAIAILLTGYMIDRTNEVVTSAILQFAWPAAALLTIFIVAGLSNAFNLVDGMNGLCGAATIVSAGTMAIIAQSVGLETHAHVLMLMCMAVFGFMLFNFPRGHLFLGDMGAYMIGFIIAWAGISIIVEAPQVSPWSILLCVFWPVADTALAIYRRKCKKMAADQPDRLHFHQLMMRAIEINWLSRRLRYVANPLTTIILTPLMAAPALAGVMFYRDPPLAFVAFILFSMLFFGTYQIGIRRASKRRLPRVLGPALKAHPLHRDKKLKTQDA